MIASWVPCEKMAEADVVNILALFAAMRFVLKLLRISVNSSVSVMAGASVSVSGASVL